MDQPFVQPKRNSWLHSFDLFSFLPVPKTKPAKSQASLIGSLFFYFLILAYFIFNFYMFLARNTPKIVETTKQLDGGNRVSYFGSHPYVAFAFFNGTDLQESYMDPSYFTVKFQQIDQYKNQKIYHDIDIKKCSQVEQAWTNETKQLYCPTKQLYMQGILGNTDFYKYFRITMFACDGDGCQTKEEQKDFWGKGRLFVYVRKQGEKNFRTQVKQPDTVDVFQYFMVQNFYNRAEVVVQVKNKTEYPDYFTSFSPKSQSSTQIKLTNYFVSQVRDNHLFTIWFRLCEQSLQTDIIYDTILDKLSQWGAMISLLFTTFSIIFIRYNAKKFYQEHKEWSQFENELLKLKNITEKQNDMINLQRKRINQLNDSLNNTEQDIVISSNI